MSKSNGEAFVGVILSLLSAETIEAFCEAVVTQTKQLYVVDEITMVTKGRQKKLRGYQSAVHLTLSVDKEKLGELSLYKKQKGYFTAEDETMLSLYAQIVSLLLKKLLRYQSTKALLEKREAAIAYASHELRNPLTAINGYIQMLHTQKKKDTSAQTRWIETLHDESLRFTELVKELLDIEKIRKRD